MRRPLPRLLALGEMQERNRIAAEKELAQDRADCIEYLQRLASVDGNDGLRSLFMEAIPEWATNASPVERIA